jgi:hypothetical protein
MSALFGKIPATVLALGGRIWLSVCMATAVLVAAGFVFNEVFFHRFPNFAFAFVLLGFILAVQLWQQEVAQLVQMVLAAVAVGGLTLLAAAGLATWLENPQIPDAPLFSTPITGFAAIALVFVGFEVLLHAHHDPAPDPLRFFKQLVCVLLLTAWVFGLWAMVSLAAAGAERLQDTSIPHIVAARRVLGQTGRIIMGLVVIAGSAAAVNALFTATSGLIADSGILMVSGLGAGSRRRPAMVGFVLLVLASAAAMATGMAGSDKLSAYLKSGLILWVLHYAGLSAALLARLARLPGGRRPAGGVLEIVKMAALLLLLIGTAAASIWTAQHKGLIVIGMAGAATGVLLLCAFGYGFERLNSTKH